MDWWRFDNILLAIAVFVSCLGLAFAAAVGLFVANRVGPITGIFAGMTVLLIEMLITNWQRLVWWWRDRKRKDE